MKRTTSTNNKTSATKLRRTQSAPNLRSVTSSITRNRNKYKNTVILALDYDKCISDMYKTWSSNEVNKAMQDAFKESIHNTKTNTKNPKYKIIGFSNRQSRQLCNAQSTKYDKFLEDFKQVNILLGGSENVNNASLFVLKNTLNIKQKSCKVQDLLTQKKRKSALDILNTINKGDIARQIKRLYPDNDVIFVDDKEDNLSDAYQVYGNKGKYIDMTLHKGYLEQPAGRCDKQMYKQYIQLKSF